MGTLREIELAEIFPKMQFSEREVYRSCSGATTTYRLLDGNFFVQINPNVIQFDNPAYNPYSKIVAISTSPTLSSRIARARDIVRSQGQFLGFVVPGLGNNGNVPLSELYFRYNIENGNVDLSKLTLVHAELGKIVRNASDIIFPDLFGNVIIDSNREVYIVDPNGFQYKQQFIADACSDIAFNFAGIELEDKSRSLKYLVSRDNPMMFTKEVDKANLIILYFKLVFRFDVDIILSKASSPEERERMVGELFKTIGFENEDDFAEALLKIWSWDKENDWIDEKIIPRIAERYDILRRPNTSEERAFDLAHLGLLGGFHKHKGVARRRR